MASRLLEIAAEQFTMKPKIDDSRDPSRGLETGFVNNYAVEVLLEEHGQEDEDVRAYNAQHSHCFNLCPAREDDINQVFLFVMTAALSFLPCDFSSQGGRRDHRR